MYDQFSADYDRFVDWPARLAYELPFLEGLLSRLPEEGFATPLKVVDAACGTGMHAIALAQRGYQVTGADLSAGMIAQARRNAASAGAGVWFIEAGFGALAPALRERGWLPAAALLCLGNSLPHLLSPSELAAALADFAACLRPDGLLLLQNRNFDAVMRQRNRWMEPQAQRAGEDEWLFVRFYDFLPDGNLTFNILRLHRGPTGGWQQQLSAAPLRPLLQAELLEALASAGFDRLQAFGDLAGSPFDPAGSPNLVVLARKRAGASGQPEDALP
jgi:glycine/sarcosine N-methyltransferase